MRKLLLLSLLLPVIACAGLALYFLSSLDNIVHGTLYNYGLQFSYDWASPYWSTFRIIQLLIGSTAILSLFSLVSCLVIVDRTQVHVKQPRKAGVVSQTVAKVEMSVKSEPASERKIVPQPINKEVKSECVKSEVPSAAEKFGGFFRCNHCNRVFSQPLRMLDFQENQPRIISICPFCNEVIQPLIRNNENDNEKRHLLLRRNNDNEKITLPQ